MLDRFQDDLLMSNRDNSKLLELVGSNAQQLTSIDGIVRESFDVRTVHAFQT